MKPLRFALLDGTTALICGNCRLYKHHSEGRCDTCYRYWRRTGKDRPAEKIDALEDRRFAALRWPKSSDPKKRVGNP